MKAPLTGDELWGIVEPLLPPEPPRLKGGRPRAPNRSALEGIIYVLKSLKNRGLAGTPIEVSRVRAATPASSDRSLLPPPRLRLR